MFEFHCTKTLLSPEQRGNLYLATGEMAACPSPPYCSKKGPPCYPLFEEEHVDLQFTSSVPLAFVSNSEHSVLQKLNNHIINVLTEFFVSFSCQMKVIKHVLVAYDAITPYKAWIRVQVN